MEKGSFTKGRNPIKSKILQIWLGGKMKRNYREESLIKHKEWKGKIEVGSKVPVNNAEDLSLAYTPGVAEVP